MGRLTIRLRDRISCVAPTLGSRLKTLKDAKLLDEVAMNDDSSFIVYRDVSDISSQHPVFDLPTATVVAEAVTDTITSDIEPILLRGCVANSYFRTSKQLLEKLFQDAIILLHDEEEGFLDLYNETRDYMITRIRDYIMTNDYLDLLGFIRFRLKEYGLLLQNVVDKAIDDYLKEQEHEEIISLLRNYVDRLEPQMGEVNVVVEEPGVFKLIDSEQNIIDNEYLVDAVAHVLIDGEVDYHDLLVSALITIAPRTIVLHYRNRFRAIDTIEGIFGSRVATCQGCSLCNSSMQTMPDN